MDKRQREDLAERIRNARAELGWSQVELAEKAGVAPNTVLGIESGTSRTQAGKLRAVMDALGLEPTMREMQRPGGVPDDVELITQVVRAWLMGVPAGEQRAAATLGLMRYMLRESSTD